MIEEDCIEVQIAKALIEFEERYNINNGDWMITWNSDERLNIGKEIEASQEKLKNCLSKGGVVQHSILFDLFDYLNKNGGCCCINRRIKKLKTQDNIIETYMCKYGIKMELTMCYKYNKCTDIRIKLL